jgi:hypothetical protein
MAERGIRTPDSNSFRAPLLMRSAIATRKRRREEIFCALWTNRARPMYIARVDALNMIDV